MNYGQRFVEAGIKTIPRKGNAKLACNLQNDRVISVCFQGKPFNIPVTRSYVPTTGAEVEWFYEDLQDLLELTPQKMSFSL